MKELSEDLQAWGKIITASISVTYPDFVASKQSFSLGEAKAGKLYYVSSLLQVGSRAVFQLLRYSFPLFPGDVKPAGSLYAGPSR